MSRRNDQATGEPAGSISVPAVPYPIARRLVAALITASLAAACAVLGAAPAHALAIRSEEWPLDASHYNADVIWKITRGQGVTVAVVDSGVDIHHPDLNGQVLPGVDLTGTSGDGTTDTSPDSHGTAIAGIIAGTGANDHGTGMIGLSPAAKILPIRIATTQDGVDPATLAQGIVYAATNGAQIINVSLGAEALDPEVQQAVSYAINHNIIVVAAAGNTGQTGNLPQYPAAIPGVIAVTGITSTGDFWPTSNSGPYAVLAAPAADIHSTNNQGQYVDADGTSYAAGYVSAAAALIRAHNPQLTAGQIISQLIHTADPPAGGQRSNQLGYGRLNPLRALTSPIAPSPTGNPLLTAPIKQNNPSGDATLTVVFSLVGAVILVGGGATLLLWRRHRARRAAAVAAAKALKEAQSRTTSRKAAARKRRNAARSR